MENVCVNVGTEKTTNRQTKRIQAIQAAEHSFWNAIEPTTVTRTELPTVTAAAISIMVVTKVLIREAFLTF